MFKRIKRFLKNDSSEVDDLIEMNELLIRAGKRCAFDLRHASEEAGVASIFKERADMWCRLFTSGGSNDYRHRLHREVSDLQHQIKLYEAWFEHKGIENDVIPPI